MCLLERMIAEYVVEVLQMEVCCPLLLCERVCCPRLAGSVLIDLHQEGWSEMQSQLLYVALVQERLALGVNGGGDVAGGWVLVPLCHRRRDNSECWLLILWWSVRTIIVDCWLVSSGMLISRRGTGGLTW